MGLGKVFKFVFTEEEKHEKGANRLQSRILSN